MMNQYLVDFVRKNVWCNPFMDNQWVLALRRITRRIGELNRFTLMDRVCNLPERQVRFHVFQIGQVGPQLLGLLSPTPIWTVEEWFKLSDVMMEKKLIANFYDTRGVNYPRDSVYYKFTNERALILAVKEDRMIPVNLGADDFYLRVYSNSFFESSRADEAEENIEVLNFKIRTISDILPVQSAYLAQSAKKGFTYAYQNGRVVSHLDAVNLRVNDTIELVRDGSVKRLVSFNIQDLNSFESTLDNVFKYLLHYNNGLDDNIDFQDDIDIHIQAPVGVDRFAGLYYHRNDVTSHRMVTHRDYSVPVNHVTYVVDRVKELVENAPADGGTYRLQMVIREAGYHRQLVFENNRIFELYKLDDDKALAAMVGLESSLPLWRAENLEMSAYTQAMRVKWNEIDQVMTQEVLGYNGMSKITGDTPSKTVLSSGHQMTAVPEGLQKRSTAYLYDFNGHLIGSQLHSNQQYLIASNPNTRLAEIIYGHGSDSPEVAFGTNNVPIPLEYNYRVYQCLIVAGEEDNNWVEITDNGSYSIVNNQVVLNAPNGDEFLMVRNDGSFLDISLNLTPQAGNLFFTLYEIQDRGMGEGAKQYTLPVPLGELDVWLNGKSLIRGLDYIYQFPKITIINKIHLNQPSNQVQHLRVRFTGFAVDGQLDPIEDFGFINHGFLSNNNRHDIRDDKVLRITVRGSLKHRDDIQFSEEHAGISITNPTNGWPYQIKDIVVPLHGLENENTYTARTKSIEIDEAVSDYLTLKLPEPERGMNAVVQKYVLFSPFFSRIIHGLKEGTLTGPFEQNLSDAQIMQICQPFEHLLLVDPLNEDLNMDYRYITVHPHCNDFVMSLNFFHYRFLNRVVGIYGRNMIDLSTYVSIE